MHLPSWTLLNTQPHHSPTSTLSTPWPNWVSLWTPFFISLSPYTHKCMVTHCSMFNLPGLPPWRKLTLLHLSTPETPQLGLMSSDLLPQWAWDFECALKHCLKRLEMASFSLAPVFSILGVSLSWVHTFLDIYHLFVKDPQLLWKLSNGSEQQSDFFRVISSGFYLNEDS